jgi:hypothetical protein
MRTISVVAHTPARLIAKYLCAEVLPCTRCIALPNVIRSQNTESLEGRQKTARQTVAGSVSPEWAMSTAVGIPANVTIGYLTLGKVQISKGIYSCQNAVEGLYGRRRFLPLLKKFAMASIQRFKAGRLRHDMSLLSKKSCTPSFTCGIAASAVDRAGLPD